jgi:hypothetical protein
MIAFRLVGTANKPCFAYDVRCLMLKGDGMGLDVVLTPRQQPVAWPGEP